MSCPQCDLRIVTAVAARSVSAPSGLAMAGTPTKGAPGGEKLTAAEAGVIRKAMAFRVKYRVVTNGQVKRRIQLAVMGVHPSNRGGVYPNEDRVKGLGVDILRWGADCEEADHNGVTVEEIPTSEREKHPQLRIERYADYNRRKCNERPLLQSCFQQSDVFYGNLSHNTLLLVLLSWATSAKWDLKGADEKPYFCDSNGCLDQAAVAEKDEPLEFLIKKGLLMETLSYKMLLEEPEAASLISQALNKGQEAACRTSELTALAVLTGTIALHEEGKVWRELDYQTIQEKLRSELDYFVDEPEFIEMFECVISLGAHTNSYIQELLEFGDRFVDSKFRQLRLSAFTEVNKIPGSCPRSKLAILKRAYRKKPQYGYCPSPEASWRAVPETQLLDLESLLQYFHFNCKAAVAEAIPKENVIAFLSNVDVAASEAFFVEKREKCRKQAMLKAIVKYYEQLHDKASEKLPEKASLEKTKFEWIDFASCLGSQPEVKTAQLRMKLR